VFLRVLSIMVLLFIFAFIAQIGVFRRRAHAEYFCGDRFVKKSFERNFTLLASFCHRECLPSLIHIRIFG
jgi:hypothetical protein